LTKIKTSYSNLSRYIDIENGIMPNHEQNEKVKKVKNQDSMGKTHYPSTLGQS
jgi:hypothetical protein